MLQRCLSENERFLISGERERAAADYMFTGRGYLESSPANSSSFATAGLMFVFSWGGGSARLTYYSQDATGTVQAGLVPHSGSCPTLTKTTRSSYLVQHMITQQPWHRLIRRLQI
jgi:hypothetical protein